MRKSLKIASIILLACCLMGSLLVSCESEVDSNTTLNPPNWTIGTQNLEDEDTVYSSLVFSSDNVVWTALGSGYNLKDMIGASEVAFSEEEVSSSIYKITMTRDDETLIFSFTKNADTTLTFTISDNGVFRDIPGFIKQ